MTGAPAPVPPARPPARPRPEWTSLAHHLAEFAAVTYLLALLWLTVWAFAPSILGLSPMAIDGGSMEPAVSRGDIVLVDRSPPEKVFGPGGIVTFRDPADPGKVVTHRIVDVADDGRLVTKGDANRDRDSTTLAREEVMGAGRIVVPALGLPRVWLTSGDWLRLGAWGALTIGALLLLLFPARGPLRDAFATSRVLPPGGIGPRRPVPLGIFLGVVVAVGATALIGVSAAAFSGTTATAASFQASTDLYAPYRDEVLADSPVAYWRLGESPPQGTVNFSDDFETFAGWTDYGSGSFGASSDVARGGSQSGIKTNNNDPNGGWKSIGGTLGNDWTLELWTYRPTGWAGGNQTRIGLEGSAFDGYSFGVDHNSDVLFIDRRSGGGATRITSAVPASVPEDDWYRVTLARSGSSLVATAYDALGNQLGQVSATDSTFSSYDRVVVHGGHQFYVDDLSVVGTTGGAYPPAADELGSHGGTYQGAPALGAQGLIAGDSSTAVDLDGVDDWVDIPDATDINTSSQAQRSVELWFSAGTLGGRQVLWEEGGGTNGLSIYLDGATLYARAWSKGNGWSNPLEVTASVVAGTRYQVVLALDATGDAMTLYVDGTAVGTAGKTDGLVLAAHSGDIGIGMMNGAAEFHDGVVSGSGLNADAVIDEVAVYNSVLSAPRVETHWAAGS